MALIKKLGYCVGSKTTSIDFEEKKIPEKVEYKVIVKVWTFLWVIQYESYQMTHQFFRQETLQKLELMQMFEYSLLATIGMHSKITSGHFYKPVVHFVNRKYIMYF